VETAHAQFLGSSGAATRQSYPTVTSGWPNSSKDFWSWRTLPGAQAFMAVRSYITTARKQGINVLHALRRAFEGDPWLPMATARPPTWQLQPDIPVLATEAHQPPHPPA
jgi:hypothetical protein